MKNRTFVLFSALIAIAGLALGVGCKKAEPPQAATAVAQEPVKGAPTMDIKQEPFGQLADGTAVDVYTLTNVHGLKAKITTYGATLIALELPDRNGVFADCVLGHEALAGYVANRSYFGSTVGRYANRIAKGKFVLNGRTYTLAVNNGENHLHGGLKGFDTVVWAAESFQEGNGVGVKLTYLSKDREEGYPGNLDVSVTYLLTNEDELRIAYEARTDKPTIVNLTNHSFFNFTGGARDILGHEVMLAADRYTPVDDGLIPTGELAPFEDSPMGFATPTPIGARIAGVKGGYDHNYVLASGGGTLALAARVVEPESGRTMEVWTDQPGIQFYTGNFLDGSITGKGGRVYAKHWGFCLETQHFPDSPNRPKFPSTVLKPGEVYRTQTVHKFSVK